MQLLFYLINIVVDGIYQRSWCSSSGWSSSATLSSTVFVRVPAAYPVTYTVLWKHLVAQTFHVGDWDSSKNTQSVLWNWFHHQIRLWNLPSVFWEFLLGIVHGVIYDFEPQNFNVIFVAGIRAQRLQFIRTIKLLAFFYTKFRWKAGFHLLPNEKHILQLYPLLLC